MTAYWIVPPSPHGLFGFGVTAKSLDDALRIIRALGYGRFLPCNLATLRVRSEITVAQLEHPHVVANMGPIAIRGMWYAFVVVGIPDWADDKCRDQAEE